MDTPFDRDLRRLRRDRAAARFAHADYLFRHAADELLARLDSVTLPLIDALDLGCAGGYATDALRARGMIVTSADAGARFAAAMGGVQCDEDRLPFPPASFDLVLSVGALDTVNDLPGALIQIRRALRPDGLFLAAFAGAGSLPRLRAALQAAEAAENRPAAPRLHPQIDVRAAGDLLTRTGFRLGVADTERLDVRFSGLSGLIADLRAMAATNLLAARDPRPLGRVGWTAARARFAMAADSDGRTAERVDIVYLIGWSKPADPSAERRDPGRFTARR